MRSFFEPGTSSPSRSRTSAAPARASAADIAADAHFRARRTITEVDGTPMQNLIATLSATPGRLRWSGRDLDADGTRIRAAGWPRP